MRKKGLFFELLACKILQKNNFKIINKNIQSRLGEIDILAFKNDAFYIVEVKYRKNLDNAYCAISYQQMQKSLNTFYLYCQKNNIIFEQIFYMTFITDGKIFDVNIENFEN